MILWTRLSFRFNSRNRMNESRLLLADPRATNETKAENSRRRSAPVQGRQRVKRVPNPRKAHFLAMRLIAIIPGSSQPLRGPRMSILKLRRISAPKKDDTYNTARARRRRRRVQWREQDRQSAPPSRRLYGPAIFS